MLSYVNAKRRYFCIVIFFQHSVAVKAGIIDIGTHPRLTFREKLNRLSGYGEKICTGKAGIAQFRSHIDIRHCRCDR